MNPSRQQGRPRSPLLLAAAFLAVGVLPSLAGAGHDLTPPIPSYTGCLKGDKLDSIAQGDEPSKPCAADETVAHLSGGDITAVAAGAGLEGGALEGPAILRLGAHSCTEGKFIVRFGGGAPATCGNVLPGNFGITVDDAGDNREVSLTPQTCDIQTLVNGIDEDGKLVCVSPVRDDSVGFRRALVDDEDQNIFKNDLVIDNPGHEFIFRDADSFHVDGIGATSDNPDGSTIDVDVGTGVFVSSAGSELQVFHDGVFARTDKNDIALFDSGDIHLSNANNALLLGADGTMSTRKTTKVNNLNSDFLDGKSAEDFGIGFQRATADDPTNNIETDDLVISNPGKEFIFRGGSLDAFVDSIRFDTDDMNVSANDSFSVRARNNVHVGTALGLQTDQGLSVSADGRITIENNSASLDLTPSGEVTVTGSTSGPAAFNVNTPNRTALQGFTANPTLPTALLVNPVSGGTALRTVGNVIVQGIISSLSDRAAKQGFTPVSGLSTLELLAGIPVTTWSYKSETNGNRHMGPTAQDFNRAFGLGGSKTHISTVDADGVAFSAIQGLYAQAKAKDAKIARLEARVARLERLVAQALKSK